jgi:DNA-3-methyladenine glycosylase II
MSTEGDCIPMNSYSNDTLLLEPPLEFRLEENLAYLARSPNECLYQVADGTITRCIPVGQHKPIVSISSEPDGRVRVRIMAVAPAFLPFVRDAIAGYIAEWFDWETDLAPFYRMAVQDPLLSGPAEQFYGLRLIGVTDLFEALSWAILGQQINLTFAYTLKRRVVERFGSFAAHDGSRYWIFPTPETIAALRTEDLAVLQTTTKKAEYLIGVARLMADGHLTKEGLLTSGGLEAAENRLTGIRGIGPWTAHYVAMRCLRFRSAFPIQDVGLQLAIKALLGIDRKPTLAEVRSYAASWTGWESYATFYLWRTLY